MPHDGPSFYDDANVFARYSERRDRADNPNDTMEVPVVRELLGDLRGRRILDLGCGTAGFGREALAQDATSYIGVEGSRNMAGAARATLVDTAGVVIEHCLETWTYPVAAFDIVVARLVLHYLADIALVFDGVARALVDGGSFVFSVEHPVITSCARGYDPNEARQDWIVDDYFVTGERTVAWLGAEVRKYHRTVEDYVSALCTAGFSLEDLQEAGPVAERFVDQVTYERRKRIPLFLMMHGKRRGAALRRDPASA